MTNKRCQIFCPGTALSLPWHCPGTALALPWHCPGTAKIFQKLNEMGSNKKSPLRTIKHKLFLRIFLSNFLSVGNPRLYCRFINPAELHIIYIDKYINYSFLPWRPKFLQNLLVCIPFRHRICILNSWFYFKCVI